METKTMEATASNRSHKAVTPYEWLSARKQLLQKEKERARSRQHRHRRSRLGPDQDRRSPARPRLRPSRRGGAHGTGDYRSNRRVSHRGHYRSGDHGRCPSGGIGPSSSRRVLIKVASVSVALSRRDGSPAFSSQIEMIGTNFENSV